MQIFLFFISTLLGFDVCWSTTFSFSLVWGTLYCGALFYLLLVYSAASYFLGMIGDFSMSGSTSRRPTFTFLDAVSARLFVYGLPFFLFLLAWTWTGPSVVSGFGHLAFSSFERKVTLFVLTLYTTYLAIFSSTFHFSAVKSYDLLTTFSQLTVWLIFLFYVSNVLSLAFVIEVLTGLVTLLLVTSHAPSYHGGVSYLRYSSGSEALLPSYFFSLLFFFWTSLLTTLLLFFFLLLTYIKFLTVDWALVGVLADFMSATATVSEVSTISFSWLIGLACIFLKCGVVPFYLWKPTFFKGLTLGALFYYVFVFYFVLFLFFMNFMLGLFSEIFFFNTTALLVLLVIGVAALPSLLYETLNLKAFLALSSIMNSLIVFFLVVNFSSSSTSFFL